MVGECDSEETQCHGQRERQNDDHHEGAPEDRRRRRQEQGRPPRRPGAAEPGKTPPEVASAKGSEKKGRQAYLPPPKVREPVATAQLQRVSRSEEEAANTASHKEQPRNKPKRASSQGQPGGDVTWLQPRTQTRPGTALLGRRNPCRAINSIRGQPNQGDATLRADLGARQHGKPRASTELDIEEIIKAAREAATTHSKDWILQQIRGSGTTEGQTQEERNSNRTSSIAHDGEDPPSEAKKRQRNVSRCAKKGDKRDAGYLPDAGTPGPSKRAKANNGEQISVILQECLKSMAPLLFAKHVKQVAPGTHNSGRTQPPATAGAKSHGQTEQKRSTCNAHHLIGGSRRQLPQAPGHFQPKYGTQAQKIMRAGGAAHQLTVRPQRHTKGGTLGRPYMVARAPGLASLIPLAVKEQIWHREFIDILTLLEIQVEGLELTTVDKKEEERRERNRVRKERSFDNWLDAFRIIACIIVEKFPHCAKDLSLYESKIHKAQRQFTGDAWLDYDKGFRLKMQAPPDMEWDEEDVAGYMHKMMIAREAKSWANKGEQPFRGSSQKGGHEKAKPFHKRQNYTQWKGPQAGRASTAVCYNFEKNECTWGAACKFRRVLHMWGRPPRSKM
ncbi:hypothetical protein NDU88_007857 [Pleurodeles waltl]|uniref:C3H1-type domain-containing protein n=1 Tax=Pleurodeles waltl TaxID=8319 RepID=A0AAV7PQI7_PLEWA|nr:hypothetical protein NDU88_007857 [Pleurodeles waltl]